MTVRPSIILACAPYSGQALRGNPAFVVQDYLYVATHLHPGNRRPATGAGRAVSGLRTDVRAAVQPPANRRRISRLQRDERRVPR
ncbi:hypothetical protein D3C75_1131480 [compost metagenome]